MFGLFKINNVCKNCFHAISWHRDTRNSDVCSVPRCKCLCTNTPDNLTYVEYVTKQTWWKKIITETINVPLRFYCYYRGKDDLDDFIALKCVLFPLLGCALLTLIGLMFSIARDNRANYYIMKHSVVDCYTGDKLLYSGPVDELEYQSGGVKIETSKGDKYFCSAFHSKVSNARP